MLAFGSCRSLSLRAPEPRACPLTDETGFLVARIASFNSLMKEETLPRRSSRAQGGEKQSIPRFNLTVDGGDKFPKACTAMEHLLYDAKGAIKGACKSIKPSSMSAFI